MSAHTHVKWGTWAEFGKSVGVTGPSAAAATVATAAIRDAGFGAFVEVVSTDGKSVAVALGEDQQEALANANKIAAAPELLEALITCRKALSAFNLSGILADQDAETAIAKATGGAA